MNPFLITAYKEPKFFCNREKETQDIINAITNQRNLLIFAIRRMGKTGLIRHVFYQLQMLNQYSLYYIDIDQTTDLNGFMNVLINGLIKGQKQSLYEKIIDIIKQFRPTITFDPITGTPEIEIKSNTPQDSKASIEVVLNYLENLDKPVVVAIDEFQRIVDYPENRVEAFLRSHIQHLKNVTFIFSGSQSKILQAMFSQYNRPFYQSAQFLEIGRLGLNDYSTFISEHFIQSGKKIEKSLIKSCIEWADHHTFYVQYIFNVIWGSGEKIIDESTIKEIKTDIIDSRSALYTGYRSLLTEKQFNVLKAIGSEGEVAKPNSHHFIEKYSLGSVSTVNSAIKALLEKELIYAEKNKIKCYDVFQAKWFQLN